MATARKLPSGSWRVRVYDYTDTEGKKHYISFTASTKQEAEKLANNYSNPNHKSSAGSMTFGEAVDQFIQRRTPVLSAGTIKEYIGYSERYMKTMSAKKISKITQTDVQREVNTLALSLSPKTVRNVHGFISAVMAAYRPDFALHTVLPKKVPPKIYVPSEAEIQRLMDSVKGTVMELPILLAAFGPMRRGEICALRAENIDGNVVHVCENMIQNKDNQWIIKAPKSFDGDRYIDYPDFVAEKWYSMTSGRITQLNPTMITKRFEHCLQHAGLPHFRFHDLRHYSASIQHALGIPDAYIMQRGGWKNDGVLKQVYRHAMKDKTSEMSDRINSHFSEMYDTKYDTKKEKAQ